MKFYGKMLCAGLVINFIFCILLWLLAGEVVHKSEVEFWVSINYLFTFGGIMQVAVLCVFADYKGLLLATCGSCFVLLMGCVFMLIQ